MVRRLRVVSDPPYPVETTSKAFRRQKKARRGAGPPRWGTMASQDGILKLLNPLWRAHSCVPRRQSCRRLLGRLLSGRALVDVPGSPKHVCRHEGREALCAADFGRNPTQIGAGCGIAEETPAWSPDGSRILFGGQCPNDALVTSENRDGPDSLPNH